MGPSASLAVMHAVRYLVEFAIIKHTVGVYVQWSRTGIEGEVNLAVFEKTGYEVSLRLVRRIKQDAIASVRSKLKRHSAARREGRKSLGRLQKHSLAIVYRNQWLNWFP